MTEKLFTGKLNKNKNKNKNKKLSKYTILSFQLSSVVVQPSLCRTWLITLKTDFLMTQPISPATTFCTMTRMNTVQAYAYGVKKSLGIKFNSYTFDKNVSL